MEPERRETAIFTAGMIIGMLTRFTTEEWFDVAETANLKEDYKRSIRLLAELHKEIISGGPQG